LFFAGPIMVMVLRGVVSNPVANHARGTTLVRSVIDLENMDETHPCLRIHFAQRPPRGCLPTYREGSSLRMFGAHWRRTYRKANAAMLEAGRGKAAGMPVGSGRMADG
ncbi:MAG: hypothetical protein ACKOHG_17065, partial [Planctomycetia bacterium]